MNFKTAKVDIRAILERTVQKIQARMDNAGVNASKRTRASFKVRVNDEHVLLVGGGQNTAPVDTLEVGRQGGKVPKGFTDILEQWSRDKGLSFDTDAERRSFAYLLGRRIAREGTIRHAQNVDIYSSIVSDTQDDLQKRVSEIVREQIIQAVKNYTVSTAKQRK